MTRVETQPGRAESSAVKNFRAGAWILRGAVFLVSTGLLLAGLEGALRLANVGYPSDITVPCTLHGQPASCYNLFFPAPFFPPGMIKTPQAYAIPVTKAPNAYRIVVLGESAAMGDPDPAYSFSRFLEVMLRDKFPSMEFGVINTGSVAVNSHVSLLAAKGLAKQKPDLFIIYSGNNEVVGPYGPGTVLTSSAMSLPIIRADIFVRSTRIGELLTKVGTQKKEWGGMEMFMRKQVAARSPLMVQVYNNFAANLRDTIKVAQDSGARVIVSTIATNLKDCGPFASAHRDNLSPTDQQAWEALVQKGSNFENERSYAAALSAYESAAKIDDQYAELEFRIARSLWMTGDYDAAKRHFMRARDLDTLRFRADTKINDVNRSVAAATGAELVDAEAILAANSPHGIIGSEYVYEHVHMTPEGNYLAAKGLFLEIASKMSGQPGHAVSESDVLSQADCEKLLALTAHDRLRMKTEMLERLQKEPFVNQINHQDQVLRLTIQTSVPDEDPQTTAAEYQWAIAKAPDDRILHYNFGLFLFDHDRAAAADQLRQARPWDDFPVFAPDGTLIQ